MDNLKAVNPRRAFVRTLRKLLSRRLLASKIDLFHEPALIHEMNAIPRHSEFYKRLYLEALMREHSRRFGAYRLRNFTPAYQASNISVFLPGVMNSSRARCLYR